MSEITEQLKLSLSPKGTVQAVPLEFLHTRSGGGYVNVDFVHECIDEIDKVIFNSRVLGQRVSPLEKLAIMLLVESAGYKDAADLEKWIQYRKSKNEHPDDPS